MRSGSISTPNISTRAGISQFLISPSQNRILAVFPTEIARQAHEESGAQVYVIICVEAGHGGLPTRSGQHYNPHCLYGCALAASISNAKRISKKAIFSPLRRTVEKSTNSIATFCLVLLFYAITLH